MFDKAWTSVHEAPWFLLMDSIAEMISVDEPRAMDQALKEGNKVVTHHAHKPACLAGYRKSSTQRNSKRRLAGVFLTERSVSMLLCRRRAEEPVGRK